MVKHTTVKMRMRGHTGKKAKAKILLFVRGPQKSFMHDLTYLEICC